MASRGNVDVSERRLRPIYDCLDNGNNKKAVQEADKVLKKQSDLLCAKVLKALALLRLGQHDECVALVTDVFQQHPSDEPTLQAMTICYKELHQLHSVAEMYENAHQARPKSEDILSSLFMAYVRVGNYKKQQQTAMSLHRLQPTKNPYYFWAIMSIVMQAHFAEEKLAKTMFLPLALRMAEKYVNENKIEAEAEVQMYLIILQLLDKSTEVLRVLQSPLADMLISEIDYRHERCAYLYGKLGRWSEMNAAYRKLLCKNPDAWNYYQQYFVSLFKLIDESWTPESNHCNGADLEGRIDHTVDEAVEFLQEQASHGERGPRLAQLHLAITLEQRDQPVSEQLGSCEDLLRAYYNKYSHRACCYDDMMIFLSSLDEQRREKLVQDLFDEHGYKLREEDDISYAKDVNTQQDHITLLQLARYVGLPDKLTESEKCAFVAQLVKRHRRGYQFGEELLTTDLQYSDNYLQLAVLNLYDIWQQNGNQSLLWQAVMLLEDGILKCPANYQFKILLIKIYEILGAVGPAASMYGSLEVKNIQNDTLGYLLHGPAARFGQLKAAQVLYDKTLRFFTVNHKDTTEYILSSYKYGSFTKTYEFVKFRERLQNSLQYACTTAERMLLYLTLETKSHCNTESMLTYMEIDPESDKTVWEDLTDNRDFDVLNTWDRDRTAVECMKASSFKEEKSWLAVRNLTLRCLAAAVMLAPQSTGVATCQPSVLVQLLSELRQHTERMENVAVQTSLCGAAHTRFTTYVALQLHTVLTNAFEAVLYVHAISTENNAKECEKKQTNLTSSIHEAIADVISNTGSVLTEVEGRVTVNADVLEKLVLIAETISHVVLVAGCCCSILKPMRTRLTKKTRKKKAIAEPLPSIFTHVGSLVKGLKKNVSDLQTILKDAKDACLALEMSHLQLNHDMFQPEESHADVWRQVVQGYEQSFNDLISFVNCKQLYLDSLDS